MTLFHNPVHSQADRSPLDVALDRLPSRPVRSGAGYAARCPAHNDQSPSLSISTGRDGRVLIKCWAGCTTESVLEALGLKWQDLFTDDTDGRWTDDAR